jgi:hypothetical protein
VLAWAGPATPRVATAAAADVRIRILARIRMWYLR